MLTPGQKFLEYEIVRPLGRGGFGVFFAYRAALALIILVHWTSRG